MGQHGFVVEGVRVPVVACRAPRAAACDESQVTIGPDAIRQVAATSVFLLDLPARQHGADARAVLRPHDFLEKVQGVHGNAHDHVRTAALDVEGGCESTSAFRGKRAAGASCGDVSSRLSCGGTVRRRTSFRPFRAARAWRDCTSRKLTKSSQRLHLFFTAPWTMFARRMCVWRIRKGGLSIRGMKRSFVRSAVVWLREERRDGVTEPET